VSEALTESRDDFFTRIDAGFDQFIARYAEHVFKSAATSAADRRVLNSWKVLGEGVVTSLVDMILFCLMTNVLPFRFITLVISTPIRLLTQRGKRHKRMSPIVPERGELVSEGASEKWLSGVPSVSENTTDRLEGVREPRVERAKD
jgi:hypothetical protein